MTRAYEWDGIGPKEECLLLVSWNGGESTWIHCNWTEDMVIFGSGYFARHGQFFLKECDGKFVPNESNLKITHYATLPTIARVVDLTERYRNDADEGAATV